MCNCSDHKTRQRCVQPDIYFMGHAGVNFDSRGFWIPNLITSTSLSVRN